MRDGLPQGFALANEAVTLADLISFIMSKPFALITGGLGGLLLLFAVSQILLGFWSGYIYENWTVVHGSYVSFDKSPVWFTIGLFGYVAAFALGCIAILAMMIFSDTKPD